MNWSLAKHLILQLVLSVFLAPVASAQDASRITPQMTRQLLLSQQLQEYGMGNSDPFALLNAARLLRESGFVVPENSTKAHPPGQVRMLTPDALLDKAQAMANGQPKLLALIEDERMRKGRDTTIGPQVGQMVLGSGQSMNMRLTYMPKIKAVFGITSAQLRDIALSVVASDKKNPRCEPKPRASDILCEWVPTDSPDQVEVHLTNHGRSANMLTFFHD
jgi:hypothetical protein